MVLTGCEPAMHDMYDQPKYEELETSALFDNGDSSRPLIAGTVAQASGTFAGTSSGRVGQAKSIGAQAAQVYPIAAGDQPNADLSEQPQESGSKSIPFAVTPQVLRRGQERFNINCAPCHSRTGDGDGMIVQRGFPAPPSYHTKRLRNAPDSHFYDVITHGYGIMYDYAARVAPHDRWAIVAYIRALQLSQHAPLEMVPGDARQKLSDKSK